MDLKGNKWFCFVYALTLCSICDTNKTENRLLTQSFVASSRHPRSAGTVNWQRAAVCRLNDVVNIHALDKY